MNIRIGGAYPLACGERAIYLGALEHTNYFAAVFRALWERQGGAWTGKVREGAVPASARLVAAQESAPLAMLIRDINKFSQQRHDAAAVPDHGRGRRRARQPGARRRRGARPAGGARHRRRRS